MNELETMTYAPSGYEPTESFSHELANRIIDYM